MRIRVDPQRCTGHGMCTALAPDIYQINEDTAFNEMGEFAVDDADRSNALRGMSACPEHAISVLDNPHENPA
jgi:ferredoxin